MREIMRNTVFDTNDLESVVPAVLMQSSPMIRDRFCKNKHGIEFKAKFMIIKGWFRGLQCRPFLATSPWFGLGRNSGLQLQVSGLLLNGGFLAHPCETFFWDSSSTRDL